MMLDAQSLSRIANAVKDVEANSPGRKAENYGRHEGVLRADAPQVWLRFTSATISDGDFPAQLVTYDAPSLTWSDLNTGGTIWGQLPGDDYPVVGDEGVGPFYRGVCCGLHSTTSDFTFMAIEGVTDPDVQVSGSSPNAHGYFAANLVTYVPSSGTWVTGAAVSVKDRNDNPVTPSPLAPRRYRAEYVGVDPTDGTTPAYLVDQLPVFAKAGNAGSGTPLGRGLVPEAPAMSASPPGVLASDGVWWELVQAKADILTSSGAAFATLQRGANPDGYVLTLDNTTLGGITWKPAGGGGIVSVFPTDVTLHVGDPGYPNYPSYPTVGISKYRFTSGSVAGTFQGFANPGVDGQLLFLCNTSPNNITLARGFNIDCPGNWNYILGADAEVLLQWDADAAKWRFATPTLSVLSTSDVGSGSASPVSLTQGCLFITAHDDLGFGSPTFGRIVATPSAGITAQFDWQGFHVSGLGPVSDLEFDNTLDIKFNVVISGAVAKITANTIGFTGSKTVVTAISCAGGTLTVTTDVLNFQDGLLQ